MSSLNGGAARDLGSQAWAHTTVESGPNCATNRAEHSVSLHFIVVFVKQGSTRVPAPEA